MRARAEGFGAWVRLEQPAALVAVDRARAARLGIDGGKVWQDARFEERSTAPIEAHMAVTSRCGAGCEGCYLGASTGGEMPAFEVLAGRLRALSRAGVFTVAFGGGEPLLRRDLGELAALARSLGLTPAMTTSGLGMTASRAAELRAFAQVNVSHDGVDGGYASVRGFDGAAQAERAVALLAEAGVRCGINMVLTRASFPRVEATARRAAGLGAREIQLLRYKPAGRAEGVAYLEKRLSSAQIDEVPALLGRLVQGGSLSVRVDCSMIPWLAGAGLDPAALERWGVLGCEAGRHLAAATIDGRVAPCSFLPASSLPAEQIDAGWADDGGMEAARQLAARPPEPCASCPMLRVCRGGCRVVAAHAGAPDGPDPECPRVVAFRASARPGSRPGTGRP